MAQDRPVSAPAARTSRWPGGIQRPARLAAASEWREAQGAPRRGVMKITGQRLRPRLRSPTWTPPGSPFRFDPNPCPLRPFGGLPAGAQQVSGQRLRGQICPGAGASGPNRVVPPGYRHVHAMRVRHILEIPAGRHLPGEVGEPPEHGLNSFGLAVGLIVLLGRIGAQVV